MSLLLSITIIALCWGVGNVLIKRGMQKLTAWQTYALDAFFIALPLWVCYGFWHGINPASVTPLLILITLFAAFTFGFYYHVLRITKISLSAPIIASYPIFTLILAYLLLAERLNSLASLGILLTILGIVLISCPSEFKFRLEQWVVLPLLVSLCYGISGYIEKVALQSTDNATFITILSLAQVVIAGFWWLIHQEPFPRFKLSNFAYSFIGIFILNIGMIIYYIALEKGFASVIVPLSNTYITITVLLSLVWLKEKITWRQMMGILAVVVGVILVGFNI